MINHAFRVQLPLKCPFCGVEANVHPEQIIKGLSVLTAWYCGSCQNDWPTVQPAHPREERRRIPDRRRMTRSDRRKNREQ